MPPPDNWARGGMLFVYGTLCFPEVRQALLSRQPCVTPGAVAGWRAAALRGRVYPGLVPAGPATVAVGQVLSDLHPHERDLLDAFEGPEYHLRRLRLTDGRSADAYVWRDPEAALAEVWDAARFGAVYLSEFVARCSSRRHRI